MATAVLTMPSIWRAPFVTSWISFRAVFTVLVAGPHHDERTAPEPLPA